MTGTWRAKLHTDPKADADRRRSPSWSRTSCRSASTSSSSRPMPALSPQEPRPSRPPAAISTARPPPASPSRARSSSSRRPRATCRASPATSSATPTSSVTPVRKPLEGLPATDADGKADIAVHAAAAAEDQPAARSRRDPASSARSGGRTIERNVTLPVDLQDAAHRHQAAVQGRPGRGGRDRALRGRPARRRRQGASTPRASSGS